MYSKIFGSPVLLISCVLKDTKNTLLPSSYLTELSIFKYIEPVWLCVKSTHDTLKSGKSKTFLNRLTKFR